MDELTGAVGRGAKKIKTTAQKRREIKTRQKQEAERAAAEAPTGPEAAPPGAEAPARGQARPSAPGEKPHQPAARKPPPPQERMRRAAVQERREQARRPKEQPPAISERPAPPARTPGPSFENTSFSPSNPSIHPSINQSIPSGQAAPQGGGRTAIKEHIKGSTAPKQKPAGGAASIKTRQAVERTAVKAPPNPIKTAAPGKARTTARRAASKARQEMERHGQRKLIQQAKQTAKAAAELSRKIAVAVTKAAAALISAVTAFAGGAVLVVALCIVILVAAIVSSPFGIFFSDEQKAPDAIAPYAAISQINTEYFARVEALKAGSYDSIEMHGAPPNWREVLAVFACKTAGTDDGVDVATFDPDRVERLRAVFWDMTTITSSVETIHHPGSGEDDPGWTEYILHITITPKTAEEMADEYNFTEDQRIALHELLAGDNGPFWAKVLYGSASDTEIVAVAFSQIGNVGGAPYWSWYGFAGREEWCACFVSWCANECGYIDAGIIPKFAGCITGSNWFKERGQWAENNIEPSPGMIIFFDWDDDYGQDGEADHVGIVDHVEDGRVYTIEGNSGDQVRQNSYPVGYYEIYGYGIPAYPS